MTVAIWPAVSWRHTIHRRKTIVIRREKGAICRLGKWVNRGTLCDPGPTRIWWKSDMAEMGPEGRRGHTPWHLVNVVSKVICVRPYKKVPCCRFGVKASGSNSIKFPIKCKSLAPFLAELREFKVVLLKKLILRKMHLMFWNVHALKQLPSWIFSW